MTPTKLPIGQILIALALALVIGGIWAGTQYAASQLA